jgi:hypothetical protein
MAKTKSKAKKLSRREMVTLLGSGVVFIGTGGGDKVEAQANAKTKAKAATTAKPPTPSSCRAVVPYKGKAGAGAAQHTILMADPCCTEGISIFFEGFDKVQEPVKGHLASFANVLNGSKAELLEYCVMVWGLVPAEQADLVKQMKEKYQMTEYVK